MTITAHRQSVARPADAPAELATFGPARLDVVDRDRSLRFSRDVVRLRPVANAGAGLDRRARSTIEGTL
jgi:hypothetical protein